MEKAGDETSIFLVDDDFESYEDFYRYFVHCINTLGERAIRKDEKNYRKEDIARALGLTSQTALSLRLNLVEKRNPRFTLNHLWLYLSTYEDFAPVEYLDHYRKKKLRKQEDAIADELEPIGRQLSRLGHRLGILKEAKEG